MKRGLGEGELLKAVFAQFAIYGNGIFPIKPGKAELIQRIQQRYPTSQRNAMNSRASPCSYCCSNQGYLETSFSLSAIQIFIMDCRGTPSRLASLSRL